MNAPLADVVQYFGSTFQKTRNQLFVLQNNWTVVRVLSFEKHESEDVAIAQLEAIPFHSWLVISEKSEHQTCEYDAWGYPLAIAKLSAKYEEEGLESPELIYTRGYVRRRILKPLPVSIYRGTNFYEISEVAGHSCSGGPIILRRSVGQPVWQVFGVYIGEAQAGFSAAYAVRSDAFYSWCPRLLGRSVREESLDT